MVDKSNLQTVANYAKAIDKSVTWVYKLGEKRDIKIILIDGIKFVQLKTKTVKS